MKTAEYEPFGDEWAKEMNKFSKAELISLLKRNKLTEKPKWISVDELVEALENMTRYHEKMASWDKGDNGYYNAKKLIQKHKR